MRAIASDFNKFVIVEIKKEPNVYRRLLFPAKQNVKGFSTFLLR